MFFLTKKFSLSILVLIFSLTIGTKGYSQERIVTGNVSTFKHFPLKNVVVKSKKLKNEVKTDSLGNFSITCKKKDVLKFDAYGFQTINKKVKSNDPLHINLIYVENDNSYKDVLKYGYLSKKNLDYCVENLLEDNNNFDQFTSIIDLIQSICPSAKFSEDPDDGREIVTIESRGPNSFYANPDALLVVDGIVVQSITDIHPSIIKTIKVLVGNEAGHWGVRGGNGAIEITLKDGS